MHSFDKCFPTEMRLSADATAHISAQARLTMWRSPANLYLFPYFNDVKGNEGEEFPAGDEIRCGHLAKMAHRLLSPYIKLSHARKPRWKADVLVIGEANREFLIPMMIRILMGILNKGLSIIYLVRFRTPEYYAITSLANKLRCTRQLICVDPFSTNTIVDSAFFQMESYYRAWQTYNLIESVISDKLHIQPSAFPQILHSSTSAIAWELIKHQLAYDTLVVRNHFHPALSAAAAIDSINNGKLVVTFQHGAVADTYSHFPILAHRIVCFGESSRKVLSTYDKRFSEEAGRPIACKDFLLGGSLFDNIKLYPNTSLHKTILVLDQSAIKTETHYGVQREFDIFVDTVYKILKQSSAVERVIIRLHPTNRTARTWMSVKDEFPDRVELSLPDYSLDFDLSRSSIVLGLFSTGLPTTAACGIPTILLWEKDWFYTPDLEGFAPNAYIAPDDAINYIDSLLTDSEAYKEARDFALCAGRTYYHEGKECDFGPVLIDQMLTPL